MRRLLVAAAAVPILAYFVFFFSFSLDLPIQDDYSVLAFAINFTNPEWPAKAVLFFSQHNEHRIVTLRATALTFRGLSLELNWVVIALLGNLGILGIALLLWKGPIRAGNGPPPASLALGFLPVVFLLFQPQHHELTLWAMCAFTNVGAVVFALLSFRFLTVPPLAPPGASASSPSESGRRRLPAASFVAAGVFGLLSVFTNGNGLFVLPLGALILLAAKKRREFVVWLGAGLLTVAFYFLGYARNPAHPPVVPFLKERPLEVGRYFLSSLGSFLDFGVARSLVPVLAGAVILAAAVALFLKRLERKDPFLSAAGLFVVFSIAAQSLTRAPFGALQSLDSRYKFLSALAAALVYLGWLRTARIGKQAVAAAIAAAVVFSAASFLANIPRGRETRAARLSNILDWNRGEAALLYPNPEHADSIMRLAVHRRIYEPPRAWGIDRPAYPFGGITTPKVPGNASGTAANAISGWALDDTGPPEIIVRRGPAPPDPAQAVDPSKLVEVGKIACREGTVSPYRMIYFGFPGRERMVWEYQRDPAAVSAGGAAAGPALYFFARDSDGHETLLGERRF